MTKKLVLVDVKALRLLVDKLGTVQIQLMDDEERLLYGEVLVAAYVDTDKHIPQVSQPIIPSPKPTPPRTLILFPDELHGKRLPIVRGLRELYPDKTILMCKELIDKYCYLAVEFDIDHVTEVFSKYETGCTLREV